MPQLTWPGKAAQFPEPASLHTDSVIYPRGEGYPDADPKNRLIFGDNLAIMAALMPAYEGQIDLIYIDPPFFTNKRYKARVGRDKDSRKPEEWEMVPGYADHWPDLDAYLDMLYPRLVLMHRLLAPTGSLYLHLDWHANAYARLLLDEIFGPDRLLNEIVWTYHGPSPIKSAFNRKHDTVLAYTKGDEYTFNVDDVRVPYSDSTVKTFESSDKAGFGKVPNLERGKVPEDWWYFPVVARLHSERTGYPTQKPEALLERIILAASDSGDLVADFFVGSGTTAAVAARLGRRFLATDAQWRAIHTTRSRLIRDPGALISLEREQRARIPRGESMLEDQIQLASESEAPCLTLAESLQDQLDYWEVDPAWDGKIFRSAAQAARPLRKGKIPTRLNVPTVGNRVRARLVKINGEQIVLDV